MYVIQEHNRLYCLAIVRQLLKLILENLKGMTLTMPRNEIYEYF